MNKLSLLAILSLFMYACGSTEQNNDKTAEVSQVNMIQGETPGKIVFEKESHDFGKLESGEVVSYSFKFKNEGKSTLLIKQVRPICGCTAPTYTKEPIPPGGTGEVELGFNSSGFHGMVNKSARVITNGEPSDVVLYFSAVVEEK